MRKLIVRRICTAFNNFFKDEELIKICFYVILIISLIAIFILNKHTPLIADDFTYAFSFADGSRIDSLTDIVKSMKAHYFNWGGRIVVHAIAQFFLMFDKSIFNIANTLIYGLLIMTIYGNAIPDFKLLPSALLGINLLLFLFLPAFGQDILWLVGSCNYLWGPTLVLSYLYIYRYQVIHSKCLVEDRFSILLVFVFGVIAAWTNENMSVAIISGVIIFCILSYKNNFRVYVWQLVGLLGCVTGACALILAPGNFVRASLFPKSDIVYNFINISNFWFHKDFLLIPCVIIVLLCTFIQKKGVLIDIFPYVLCLLVSLYSMICAPFYADRCKITNLVFVLIIALIIYRNIEVSTSKSRIYVSIFVIVSTLLLTKNYKIALDDVLIYERQNNMVLNTIVTARKAGNLNVVVPAKYPYTRYCAVAGLEEISSDKDYWINKSIAKYYGINSIKAIE